MIPSITNRRRKLVYFDDFDEGTLADAGWEAWHWASFGSQSQFYHRDNARIEHSCLVLETKREPYGDKQWTSALVATAGRHAFRFGRIEARMAMPLGSGFFPAFWTLGFQYDPALADDGTYEDGKTYGYPGCGEIDIMEAGGTGANATSNIWTAGGWSLGGQNHLVPDRSEFHTYQMEWTDTYIQFGVDDVWQPRVNTVGRSTALRDWGHYLILNMAMASNGNETTPSPALTLIDWVKVWTPLGAANVVEPSGVTLPATETTTVGTLYPKLLTLTIAPADAQNQAVTWESSDPTVAKVRSGTVVPVAAGVCTITATTWNGHTASTVVTVNP